MSGMDMSGMGGMDQSDDGMFRPYSQWLAIVYWYLIAAVVGLGLILHSLHLVIARIRYAPSCSCFMPFILSSADQGPRYADTLEGHGSFTHQHHTRLGHTAGSRRCWLPYRLL
jgi:hypothetical protein